MRLRSLAALLALACVSYGLSSSVCAQDVADATEAPEDGLHADVLLSGELRSGNVDVTLLGLQVFTRYRRGAHYGALRLTDAFGSVGDARFLNAFRGLAQYRFIALPSVLDGLGVEALGHYDRDELRRREHLFNAGAGPHLALFDRATVRWNVTMAYAFEFEKFAVLTSEDDPGRKARDSGFELNAHRAWLATELGWELAERVHLGQDLLFQVPLDHCACDTRVYATTFGRVYGNDYIALQASMMILYDSRPAFSVKSYDAILRSSLVLSL